MAVAVLQSGPVSATAPAWTVQPTSTLAGATSSGLCGVLCTSASGCTAVGYYTNASGTQVTLAERYS